MFRKTQHNRMFQDVVGQIQAAIVEGRLKPGDRLPSQRELVNTFQTSRASIREALRVLEHKGLIEVKLGVSGGAVVKAAGTEPLSDVLLLMMQQQQVALAHLVEFRETVEGDVAALAAARASAADIAALEGILRQAADCLSGADARPYDFIRLDIRMHIALAEISGNPVFVAVTRMVHETILGLFDRFTFRERDVLEQNYRDLCALVNAVRTGRAEQARQLALSHIRRFSRHMQGSPPMAGRMHREPTGAGPTGQQAHRQGIPHAGQEES